MATALAPDAFTRASADDNPAGFGQWVVRAYGLSASDRVRPIGGPLTITTAPGTAPPLFGQIGALAIVIGGEVDNAAELARASGIRDGASTVDVIARLYRTEGMPFVKRLAGEFSVIVSDADTGTVWAARDHLGMHPLYYTRRDGRLLLSPSLGDLIRVGGVARDIQPALLAEYLLRTYGSAEDTVFRQVQRVPPGTIARFADGKVRTERYWDPAPDDRPIEWLRDDELSHFGEVFSRSIARSMGRRRTGVFLSGGLDSVSVAARATTVARQRSGSEPLALSLEFPEPSNEAVVQSAVARQLGLQHELVRLEDAVGGEGLLARAVAMGASWPTPMMTFWNPAYAHLSSLASRHGCDCILTGRGGDEWLVLSPAYAADLLRRGRLAGMFRIASGLRRSVPSNVRRTQLEYVMTHAVRPIVAHWFARLAPNRWRAYHQRLSTQQMPSWIAPDAAVRRDVNDRAAARRVPARLPHGFYVRACKDVLTHPVITYDLEESYEFGRRNGLRVRHPFWQAELVDFLFRYPPEALNRPRRSKWLVRDELARDFPALGFDRQKKLMAYDVFTSIVRREAPPLWQRLGGARRLAELGVVDGAAVDRVMPRLLASPSPVDVARVWEIMNLESWARVQL
jgi:asparagine synthase (glutamine-hydrolysing)